MLADNHPLLHLGDRLYKLKFINQRPTSLSVDHFYAMYQSVIPKASPEAISLGGGFIAGGILDSLGINYNKIIYGIPNGITITSILRYVLKKSREATFMIIAGFFCKYPCNMSFKKVYCAGLDRLVKEVAF